MSFDAQVLAHSVSPAGVELHSLLATYPRSIHSEVMTHRGFCLAGTTQLHFDLPSGAAKGTRRRFQISIADFHQRWHHGTPLPGVEDDDWDVSSVDPTRVYPTAELAALIGASGPDKITHYCRRGELTHTKVVRPGPSRGKAREKRGSVQILGQDFLDWYAGRKRGAYPRRDTMKQMLLRCVNEETSEIIHTNVRDIFRSGTKDVFRVTLAGGYSITSSKDHLYWTEAGWKTLEEAVGLEVSPTKVVSWSAVTPLFATNGRRPGPRPRELDDVTWLTAARARALSAAEIAEELGCALDQVKHSFRRHGIKCPDVSAVLQGRTAWNTGRKYSLPHMRGISHIPPERRLRGDKHPMWRGGTYLRQSTFQGLIPAVHAANNYRCVMCDSPDDLHCHHMDPVAHNPERIADPTNLTTLCIPCHRSLHGLNLELVFLEEWERGLPAREFWQRHEGRADPRPAWKSHPGHRLVVHWRKVENIEYLGQQETYDLEVEGPWHNFVADGVIVHNSRNSASSRAVPVSVQIGAVLDTPYVPDVVGINEPGMAASAYLEGERLAEAQESVLQDRDQAVYGALQKLLGINQARTLFGSRGEIAESGVFRTEEGRARVAVTLEEFTAEVRAAREEGREQTRYLNVHKQTANRYLEAFCFHTIIITATEWDNWDGLRISEHAQPEIRHLAELMRAARLASNPALLQPGQWHLPLVDAGEVDLDPHPEDPLFWPKVSAGRCAAVSYMNHSRRNAPRDATRTEGLIANGHLSPLEHVATPLESTEFVGNFRGWRQYRKFIPNEHDYSLVLAEES